MIVAEPASTAEPEVQESHRKNFSPRWKLSPQRPKQQLPPETPPSLPTNTRQNTNQIPTR